MTELIFPLSDLEFDALEAGKTVKNHFQIGNTILLVVCWNKSRRKLNRQAYNGCMRRGTTIVIVNIPLGKRELNKIAKGNAITVHHLSFAITVCLKK